MPTNFVKCCCQHCGGGIEFDASHDQESVECPHCGKTTSLMVPPLVMKPTNLMAPPPIITPQKRFPIGIMLLGVVAIFIAVAAWQIFVAALKPEVWQQTNLIETNGISVKVGRMWINPDFVPNGIGEGVTPTEPNFHILIDISNLSARQKLEFVSWRGDASLSDTNGNDYAPMSFSATPTYLKNGGTIYPQDSFSDILVFQKPIRNVGVLHLKLPMSNLGMDGELRFEVPARIYSSPF